MNILSILWEITSLSYFGFQLEWQRWGVIILVCCFRVIFKKRQSDVSHYDKYSHSGAIED